MWHLDEIVRRNNLPEPRETERLSDFLAEIADPDPTGPVLDWPLDADRRAESTDSAELWRRETITQYAVIDDAGYVIDTFSSYQEARDVAANDEQVVPLTGEGFVKAYL